VLLKFDPTSSDFIHIDITVDNENIYKDLMAKSKVYFGVKSPPLLLQPDLIHISIVSPFNNFIIVKFYLFPVLNLLNGSKNIFVNNTAIGGGGAIYFNINNNFANILNAEFINNSASYAGAIFFGTLNPGTLLANVLFQGNNCSKKGGAIYFLTYNSGVQFYNVSFQSNTALMAGGAIYFELNNGIIFYGTANDQIHIASSKFAYNHAVNGGGGIYSAQGNVLVIKDTEFTSNKASYGGAITVNDYSNLTLSGVNDMKRNNATIGGALHMTQSYLYTGVASSMLIIANNSAERGSGIYMDSIALINNQNNALTTATFIHNYASVGGTIYWIYDSNSGMINGPNIDDAIFTNNKANYCDTTTMMECTEN
jgi:predicted outer membrane repeat protein